MITINNSSRSQQTPSTMRPCYIYYIATIALLSLTQEASAVCADKYTAEFASEEARAPLECTPFGGSPTLYAIAYGCNSPNQDETADGLVTKSFTQICTAQPTAGTNFTCYGEFNSL
jgi:hypothetical protein